MRHRCAVVGRDFAGMTTSADSLAPSRARRILTFAAGASLFCAVVLIAGVIAVGLLLSAPTRAIVGAAPTDLPVESVSIASGSGATLRGWFIPGRAGAGAVVLLHGVHGNRLAMLRRARLFHAEGFAVLLFDFQAHGESTGARITFGHREGQDAAAAVAYVRARLPNERVGAIGSSLGGAAALLAPAPLDVDALVLESVYSDIGAAIENRIIAVLGPIGTVVAPPTTALFKLLLPPFLGVSAADLRPIDRIAQVRAPVLVAGGMLDDRTSIVETRRMFARANEPKQLWVVARAAHVDLEGVVPAEYRSHVLAFMIETLRH
jgi:pimeloyl-ACP methyl ester carboxylesterase